MTPTPKRNTLYSSTAPMIIAALFSLVSLACSAENLLQAKYQSQYSGLNVEITRTVSSLEDGTYTFDLDANSAFAKISEKSIFSKPEKDFIPHTYFYIRKVLGISKKERVEFDWKKNIGRYLAGKKKKNKDHPLKKNTLDSSLYQLQLQRDLYNQAPSLSYTYIQRGSLRRRNFVVTGETTYSLNDKSYRAITLKRVSKDPDKHTEIYVIPELMYTIAYIKQVKKSDVYETKLMDITVNVEKLARLYK